MKVAVASMIRASMETWGVGVSSTAMSFSRRSSLSLTSETMSVLVRSSTTISPREEILVLRRAATSLALE